MGEIYEFPPDRLTPEAREMWWQYLEDSERAVERAKRALGIIATEKGLQ